MAIVKAMATVPPWDGADAIVVVFVSFARSLARSNASNLSFVRMDRESPQSGYQALKGAMQR